ncbi:hypothetical protein C3L33_06316, partial [Rhododendron williamsianum]
MLNTRYGYQQICPPWNSNMLESSHNLKTLVIAIPSSNFREYFWDKFPGLRNFDEEHYWTSKYRFFRCLMFYLQKVKFVGLVGSELDLYLSFVQFILENAMVLQKMVIDKLMESCKWKEEFVRAAQKLLSFPRSSRNAVVLFYRSSFVLHRGIQCKNQNHEVDHPGQKLIGSSSGEAEEEEEKENKDRDDEEGKVEEEGMLPPPKRPRNQCLDRISALHDSLILHILSFLPMEDVFMHHPDDECFPPDTNLWIRFTTQNNVEELYLRFGGFTEVHRLPQHLFTNSTLRILSVSNCIIAPGGGISWRFLKSLTFEYAEFSDGALAKILLGCPVLEFLKIHMFSGARCMDINSASLKMLVVHFCMIENDEYAAVEISAPNLQVLELGDVWPRTFRIVNVSSLVTAELNFSGGEFSDDHENMHNQLLELLERLKHVKQLHLGDWSIQVLSVGELKGLPSPKSTCKVLTIKSHIMKWDFPGILSLLRGLPDLEKLVVDLTSCKYKELFIFCKKFLDSCNSDGEDPWTSHKSSFFQFMHLTTVEIVGFKELQEGFQLPLVQFLLQNAVVLEKMVIKIGKSDDVILLPYITFGVKRAFFWKQSG